MIIVRIYTKIYCKKKVYMIEGAAKSSLKSFKQAVRKGSLESFGMGRSCCPQLEFVLL